MAPDTTASAPELPTAQMHLARPTEPVEGTVTSSLTCLKGKSNAFIRHVAIDVSGTPLAGNFLVGQSFGVIAPGVDDKGKPHKVRLYSIASPSYGEDGQGNVLSTTPKRVLDEYAAQKKGDDSERHDLFIGVCSNYLCDLKVGEKVMVTGPAGKSFLLPTRTADHDYLFVATGTGIAPFRGMVMELLDGGCKSQIHLVMGAPYTTDLLYDDLFTEYAEKHENFHYHIAISRETRPGSPPGSYRGIYVDALIDEMMDTTFGAVLENPRTLVYICGLAGMQVGLFKVLGRHGHTGYLDIKNDEIAAMDPNEWPWDKIKRYVRSSKRCMLEVY